MRRLPQVGDRVKVKPTIGKGRVMAVHMNELTSSYRNVWPAIQISLDKPYRSAPTWRAHKEELVFIKESPQAKRRAELEAKVLAMRRREEVPKKRPDEDRNRKEQIKKQVEKKEENIRKYKQRRRQTKR